MLRVLLTIALPLLLPSVLYFSWIWVSRSDRLAGGWASVPWVWLALAGALAAGFLLFVVTVRYGTSQPGTYVPAHWENGRVIPGQFEPRAR
ncbi:MAG: hypothetical protein JO001_19005 [Alphaproteobacteria bacterium]|nr:hypothetical protein [Alphaproteobacteria bacterium]